MMQQNRILKSILSGPFLLLVVVLFLSSTVDGLGSVVSRHYWRSGSHYTWEEAQSYCRGSYNDLATIYTEADRDGLELDSYDAWTGLYRLLGASWPNDWHWSDNMVYNFFAVNWAQHEPSHGDRCAVTTYDGRRIAGRDCDSYYFLICYEHHGSSVDDLKYKFIPQSKTWSEAQEYCREEYDDLADITYFNKDSAVKKEDFPVWIGLHRDGETWKWSMGTSNYRKWASGEPKDDDDNCVTISSVSKKMDARNCSERFPFLCAKDNLLLVKENKTWEQALEHCRGLTSPSDHNIRYELVSVQPEDEYTYVMQKVMEANTEEVWTGLRFLAGHWLWVNGADMMYTDLPLCPVDLQQCGSISKRNTGGLETRDCTETRNFLCYHSKKS